MSSPIDTTGVSTERLSVESPPHPVSHSESASVESSTQPHHAEVVYQGDDYRFNPLEDSGDADMDVNALVRGLGIFDLGARPIASRPAVSRFVAYEAELPGDAEGDTVGGDSGIDRSISPTTASTAVADAPTTGNQKPAKRDPFDEASLQSEETKRLVKWVEYFIRQHGGRVIGANLGSALASSNGALYRAIKAKFGGLTPLLGKFPDHFVLENDPPFNHVSLTDSHYAAAYKLMVLEAGMNKQPGRNPASDKPPEELEQDFVRHTAAILLSSPSRNLKAVELANVLRSRMGTDALAKVRETHGGLLSLLEKHDKIFKVERIPKNDCVVLIGDSEALDALKLQDLEDDQTLGMTRSAATDTWTSSLAIPSRCLHVGNVSASMTEEKLRQQFGAYGHIESLKLVAQKGRRFAFVNYATVAEAEAAKVALSKVHTWRSNISFAKRETISVPGNAVSGPNYGGASSGDEGQTGTSSRARNRNPSRHLWIGGLQNVTRSKLVEIFSDFGEVEDVHFLKDRRCAFVDFKNEDDCIMAYRMMNHRKIGDGVVELGFGRPRESEAFDFDGMFRAEDEPRRPPGPVRGIHPGSVGVSSSSSGGGMFLPPPRPGAAMMGSSYGQRLSPQYPPHSDASPAYASGTTSGRFAPYGGHHPYLPPRGPVPHPVPSPISFPTTPPAQSGSRTSPLLPGSDYASSMPQWQPPSSISEEFAPSGLSRPPPPRGFGFSAPGHGYVVPQSASHSGRMPFGGVPAPQPQQGSQFRPAYFDPASRPPPVARGPVWRPDAMPVPSPVTDGDAALRNAITTSLQRHGPMPVTSLCTEVAAILGTAAVAVDPIVSCIAAHRFAYVAPDGTVTLTSGRVPPHPGAPRA